MKRAVQIVGILLLVITCVTAHAQTVYITDTGEKYHEGSCRYLSKSKYAIRVSEAKGQGYMACKVCKPSGTSSHQAVSVTPKSRSSATTTASKQCSASTQAGTRCKRQTKDTSGKCWQHQ